MTDGALSIGEVINLVKGEFPEVSVSKVRFLESQGLLAPMRSSTGYRQFHARDVKRLRFILQQQRDHYLPLKVIKSKLVDWERGVGLEGQEPESLLAEPGLRLSLEELADRARLSASQVARLVDHGVVKSRKEGFDADAVAIAREARVLIDTGLEPRHLQLLRRHAERQAEMLGRLTAPERSSPNKTRKARKILETTTRSIEQVNRRMLAEEVRQILGR